MLSYFIPVHYDKMNYI